MSQQHQYICFCFKQVRRLSDQPFPPETSSRFRVEVFKDNAFIQKTDLTEPGPISSFSFVRGEHSNMISLALSKAEEASGCLGEIRLIERSATSSQKLVGCFVFPLRNCLTLHRQTNKNAFTVNLCIDFEFELEFQAIIESTEEGLKKMREEHSNSAHLEESSTFESDDSSFLPQDHISKILSMESFSSTLKNRFWTPKRERTQQKKGQESKERRRIILGPNPQAKLMRKESLRSTTCDIAFSSSHLEGQDTTVRSELASCQGSEDDNPSQEILEKVMLADAEMILTEKKTDYWKFKSSRAECKMEKKGGPGRGKRKGYFLVQFLLGIVVAVVVVVGLSTLTTALRVQGPS